MTSGTFERVLISEITVLREVRQRRELPEIEELAESISRLGLINPITVTKEKILVAGERRLTACKSLGWTHIPVHFAEESSDETVRAIELEENIKRVDLPWQDRARAIQEYHELQASEEKAWTMEDTAAAIGVSKVEVSRQITVAKELSNPRIAEAPKFSVAYGIVSRNNERKDTQQLEQLKSVISAPAAAERPRSIINADFREWAQTYSGPKFNLIHCDFPYGINMERSDQGSGAAHGAYDDSPEIYWALLQSLADNLDRIATPSCHLVFWFSMKYYQSTIEFLESNTDFTIEPFPLIWMKTDNVGILPDPQRGPRRIYETALLGRRGDRKVVQAVANAYGAPSVRERHMSEKPEPMLRHFFRMLVDENSLVLDPTCGSGSAIRAAESLHAKHVLGLEINPEFADRANAALEAARRMSKVAS